MRKRLEGWGYSGSRLTDVEVRRLWTEVASLPLSVRRLRLDPTSYPAYRGSIERRVFDFEACLRAIERLAEAGPRHLEKAISRAERVIATTATRRCRLIEASELEPNDRREIMVRLDDQHVRLWQLLRREAAKAQEAGHAT